MPTVGSTYRVNANGSGISFAEATIGALEEFNAEKDAEVQEAFHAGGRATRSHLRGNSPKETGAYSRSWSMESQDREGHHKVVVRNRRHYQLTHLLEDGHDVKNQYGGPFGHVGPAKPEHHIDEAAKKGAEVIRSKLGVM